MHDSHMAARWGPAQAHELHHEAIQAGMLQPHQPNDPSLKLERLVCDIGEEVRARGECCGGDGVDSMGVSCGVEAGVGGALELYMY